MNNIIQTVSYEPSEAKTLEEKLNEHLGILKMEIFIQNGGSYSGIISEIGKDYICLIQDKYDIIIPKKNILCIKYCS